MAEPTQSALRLYGVVDADDAHPHAAMSGVVFVHFRDLAAVVAPSRYVRATTDDDLLMEYVRVVDTLFTTGPIVPAPPGTVFRSTQTLQRWLELHYATLQQTLGIIESRGDSAEPYTYIQMQLEG